MICEDARRRLNRRLDEGSADAELDRHLASCATCRTYTARLQLLAGVLDEIRVETESVACDGGEPLNLQVKARPRRFAWGDRAFAGPLAWRAARVAAAIAIVLGALYLVLPLRRSSRVAENVSSTTVPAAVGSHGAPHDALGVTLRGDSAERFIVAARPSSRPDVQVFWLYPAIRDSEQTGRSRVQ